MGKCGCPYEIARGDRERLHVDLARESDAIFARGPDEESIPLDTEILSAAGHGGRSGRFHDLPQDPHHPGKVVDIILRHIDR